MDKKKIIKTGGGRRKAKGDLLEFLEMCLFLQSKQISKVLYECFL
jgi:hypothetical protein